MFGCARSGPFKTVWSGLVSLRIWGNTIESAKLCYCNIAAVIVHSAGSQYEYERTNDDNDKDKHNQTFVYENEANTLNFWRSQM